MKTGSNEKTVDFEVHPPSNFFIFEFFVGLSGFIFVFLSSINFINHIKISLQRVDVAGCGYAHLPF